jgi:hypothetical protein
MSRDPPGQALRSSTGTVLLQTGSSFHIPYERPKGVQEEYAEGSYRSSFHIPERVKRTLVFQQLFYTIMIYQIHHYVLRGVQLVPEIDRK